MSLVNMPTHRCRRCNARAFTCKLNERDLKHIGKATFEHITLEDLVEDDEIYAGGSDFLLYTALEVKLLCIIMYGLGYRCSEPHYLNDDPDDYSIRVCTTYPYCRYSSKYCNKVE